MTQCTSVAPGPSNSNSAPPPIRPTVMHNLLNWYARPFDRPSITEIVIVTLSSNGTSGILVEPWPFGSRSYFPLTDGDSCQTRVSLLTPRLAPEFASLIWVESPHARRSLKGSPPF